MTFEKYQIQINLINNQLTKVSTQMLYMTVTGEAIRKKSYFKKLLIEHQSLTAQSEKLSKAMMRQK